MPANALPHPEPRIPAQTLAGGAVGVAGHGKPFG